jgi:hypothetical protein
VSGTSVPLTLCNRRRSPAVFDVQTFELQE